MQKDIIINYNEIIEGFKKYKIDINKFPLGLDVLTQIIEIIENDSYLNSNDISVINKISIYEMEFFFKNRREYFDIFLKNFCIMYNNRPNRNLIIYLLSAADLNVFTIDQLSFIIDMSIKKSGNNRIEDNKAILEYLAYFPVENAFSNISYNINYLDITKQNKNYIKWILKAPKDYINKFILFYSKHASNEFYSEEDALNKILNDFKKEYFFLEAAIKMATDYYDYIIEIYNLSIKEMVAQFNKEIVKSAAVSSLPDKVVRWYVSQMTVGSARKATKVIEDNGERSFINLTIEEV